MELFLSLKWRPVLAIFLLVVLCSSADCYDPLDPDGNITVTFDIYQWTEDGYMARVTLQNYYQYRHVDRPGWQLGWSWAKGEVIWTMNGAFATQQGNCSDFKDALIPHSCRKDPTIIDMPDNMQEDRSENCCHGGVLSAMAIDPSKSFSSFEIKVGNLHDKSLGHFPQNLTLMAPGPGYTCGAVRDYVPTVYPVVGGQREAQAFRTWKSACTYSPFVANTAPTCCVSLSTFYSPTITQCPLCSCGCRVGDKSTRLCLSQNSLASAGGNDNVIQCTDHMCPVRVHWHVKSNYKNHWRIKLTVSNYHYGRNYSDWNLLVQHPGIGVSPNVYSFNSTILQTVGFEDEVALFWGLINYNQMLLQATDDEQGSVRTEILMKKNADSFTLVNGWALPRRIYFNGETCEMPPPDDFPMLPSSKSILRPTKHHLFCLLIALYLLLQTV